jgi:hypothetical protein
LGVNTDLFEGDLNEDNLSELLEQAMNFDTTDAIQAYR